MAKLNLPNLTPYGVPGDGLQTDFVLADEHFICAAGGIGSGKSIGGAHRAILASCGQVGSKRIPTPNLGIVTAPTYTMLKDATLRAYLEYAGGLVSDFNKNEMKATLINGSEVLFRSADNPDRLRGPNASWHWGDEAAYSTDSLYKVMVGRLRQYGQLGYMWLTTTPKGRNWIWKRFVQDAKEGYRLFTMPTWANPFLDEEIYQAWLESYAGDFALQELEGEFIAYEGLIYPRFDRGLHARTKVPENFVYTVAGVDWGFVHPGVILIFGVDYDGRLWLIHEEYQRKRNIEDWAVLAGELNKTYRPRTWWCDPSEPTYIAKFKAQGCKATEANNEVKPGIQRVENRLVRRDDGLPRLVVASWAANTITEFEQYKWAEVRGELKEEPMKTNDHTMDAMRYVVNGIDAAPKHKPMIATAKEY